jgi:agmatinase
VYVSVDLDVVDPTLFDATGHPSPGGATVTALLTAVRKVVAGRTLVGLDVVEPLPDDRQNASTGMLVSRLVLDALRANLEPQRGADRDAS